jgi:hypothetical protein
MVSLLPTKFHEIMFSNFRGVALKNVCTIADYDYPNHLFHIYSMISRFDAHCDFIILFLKVLTLSVPVIMAVLFVIL